MILRAPFAIWRPGNPAKVGYPAFGERGAKRGDVKHSAEGDSWDAIHDGLDDIGRRASWHFTVGYDRIEQHYEIDQHCWHAADVDDDGAVRANIDLVGIEHLGMAGTSLTPFQIDATVKLSRFCADQFGRSRFARYPDQDGWTLVEHKQVADLPTACPSNRIPWGTILMELNKEGIMSAEGDAIRAEMKQGFDDVERFMIGIAQNLSGQIAVLHSGDTAGLQAQIDALKQQLKDAAAKLGG